MFTSADVKLMETRLNPKLVEACTFMAQARAWLRPNIDSLPWIGRIIDVMDVRCVMHVHGFAKKLKTPGHSILIWKRSPTNLRKMCKLLVAF